MIPYFQKIIYVEFILDNGINNNNRVSFKESLQGKSF